MSEIIDWIGSPSAYNWITLLGAFAAIMTAIFTGYSAATQWRDRGKRVHVEWEMIYEPKSQFIRGNITNLTRYTIESCSIKVGGPLANIVHANGSSNVEKHESWARNQAPASLNIAPGAKGTVIFKLYFDPSELRRLSSSKRAGMSLWFAKHFWQMLGWRILSGVKLPILLMLRRKSSHIRPIRVTHVMSMNAPTAIKIAESIEAIADKT